MLTEAQWARVKAYAALVNENSDLITSYKGDLVYDGALLATNDSPVIAILRDSGTHLYDDPSLVEATRRAFGSGADDSIRYFLGENAPEGFAFQRVEGDQATEALREAQARLLPPPLPPPAVAAGEAAAAEEELYEAIRDAEAVLDAAIELGVTTDAMYPCQRNLEKLLKENGQWLNS